MPVQSRDPRWKLSDDKLEKARVEVKSKGLKKIQHETAITWAWRARAAKEEGLAADAVEYEHEAIEHAALTGDDAVLAEVRGIINPRG